MGCSISVHDAYIFPGDTLDRGIELGEVSVSQPRLAALFGRAVSPRGSPGRFLGYALADRDWVKEEVCRDVLRSRDVWAEDGEMCDSCRGQQLHALGPLADTDQAGPNSSTLGIQLRHIPPGAP